MSDGYTPNHIPRGERIASAVVSVVLLGYGSYGLWVNDLYLPGRRSKGIHLHDLPAWVMYAAIVCACLVMLSVVADHYDKRNNETNYRRFAQVGRVVGWTLFGLSLIISLIRQAA
jgi:hypothetical protein